MAAQRRGKAQVLGDLRGKRKVARQQPIKLVELRRGVLTGERH